MNNIEKKNWETPAVTKLSVKELTQTGIKNGVEKGNSKSPS
ncbi:hypothetical protein [Aequorivita sediminis]|nr:hypothetical protein [Aequorivita sp. F6058]